MSMSQVGDIIVGEGIHPFYIRMNATALFQALVGWRISEVEIDESMPPDAVTVSVSRDGFVFDLVLDRDDLTERNLLTIDIVDCHWPEDGPNVPLLGARELAGRLGVEIEIEGQYGLPESEAGALTLYRQVGKDGLRIYEDGGRVSIVTIS